MGEAKRKEELKTMDLENIIKQEPNKGVLTAEQMMTDKSPVKKDKLAIVGFAPSTLYMTNDLDDSYEVWGMNELYQLALPEVAKQVGKTLALNKFTRWIEIHSRQKDKEGKAYCDDVNIEVQQGKLHITNLNEMPHPVYMRGPDMEIFKDVKNAVAFPYKEIVNFFGRKYFTNTVSWMLGLALYEAFAECGIDVSKPCKESIKGNYEKLKNFKWKKIVIYGVDMSVGWAKRSNGDDALQNEYASQRPSCEWVIGIIDGLQMAGVDIEIEIPKKSSLLKKYSLYGFEDLEPELNQIRIDWLERVAFCETRMEQIKAQALNIQQKANQQIMILNQQSLVMQGTLQEIQMNLSTND